MSLDAEPIRLTKRGRIVIEPDGRVLVSDFDGENVTCREVCVLALGWAIQHLTAEMVKDIERPGGSELVIDATEPPTWSDDDEGADSFQQRRERVTQDMQRGARQSKGALPGAAASGAEVAPPPPMADTIYGCDEHYYDGCPNCGRGKKRNAGGVKESAK